jgi:hypothetical protein
MKAIRRDARRNGADQREKLQHLVHVINVREKKTYPTHHDSRVCELCCDGRAVQDLASF